MRETVQVTLNKAVYDRLQELQTPPYNDINAVIERLLFHEGRGSYAAQQLEAEGRHYTFDEEIARASEGIYGGSGIGT